METCLHCPDTRTLVKRGVLKKYSMVNTFLPFPDFNASAKALDNKRLGKQRVEALQILKANLGLTKGWANHPAAVMWRGYEGTLCDYAITICYEWMDRGYNDSVTAQITNIRDSLPDDSFGKPWWLGNDVFHQSHQSNLVRKDPVYYTYQVSNDLPYVWPRQDGTLKTKEQIHEDKVLLQDKQRRRKGRSVVSNRKRQGTRNTKRRTTKAGTRKRVVKPSSS